MNHGKNVGNINNMLEIITRDNNNYKEQIQKEKNKKKPNTKELGIIQNLYNDSVKKMRKIQNETQFSPSEGFRENLGELDNGGSENNEQNENLSIKRMIQINRYENDRMESQKYMLKVVSYISIIILIYINITSMSETLGLFKYIGIIILMGIVIILIGKEHLRNIKRDKHNWNKFDWGHGIPDNKTNNGISYGSDGIDIYNFENGLNSIKDKVVKTITDNTRGSVTISTNVDSWKQDYERIKTVFTEMMKLGCNSIKTNPNDDFKVLMKEDPMTSTTASALNFGVLLSIFDTSETETESAFRGNQEFQKLKKEFKAIVDKWEHVEDGLSSEDKDKMTEDVKEIMSKNVCFKVVD